MENRETVPVEVENKFKPKIEKNIKKVKQKHSLDNIRPVEISETGFNDYISWRHMFS